MTLPNTPPDQPSPSVGGSQGHAAAGAPADRDPFAAPLHLGPEPAAGKERRAPAPELQIGAATVVACVLLGLAMAALWAWLAPKVPLQVDGNRVLYADPEGEQRAGADAVFALLGLGAGVLTALGAFLVTRRRGGGIAVAVGLAVGGLLGSLGARWLGVRLGPDADLLAQAARAGDGGRFEADLELGAQGALLAWPMAAMVVLLALSAAFGKREEDPPPYWAGPYPGQAAPEPAPGTGLPPAAPQPHDAAPDRKPVHPAPQPHEAAPQDRHPDTPRGMP
ncbi:hypothetical protein ACWGB8_05025 [Kitasatospora sp. NPDC054939]